MNAETRWKDVEATKSRRVVDLHRLMNMLNQFHKTSGVHGGKWAPVARPRNEARKLVIIVIAARVKPRVENEPNVTCAGDGVHVSHTCPCVQTHSRETEQRASL